VIYGERSPPAPRPHPELGALLEPGLSGEADIAVGSRFAGVSGYRQSLSRNLANRVCAGTASLVTRQRVTDPSSGFQALNRRAIALFAADYPHEFPEVEATLALDAYGCPVENVYLRRVVPTSGVDAKYAKTWNVVTKTYPHVSQFWTYDPKEYLSHPVYSRTYPPCNACQ